MVPKASYLQSAMMTLLASGTLSRSCARLLSLAFGTLFCSTAWTQSEAVFSVDWQGQTVGQLDGTTNSPITDGDLLVQQLGPLPGNLVPLPPPQIRVSADFLQAYALCAGHLPGVSCGLEVDAVSFGNDALLMNTVAYQFGLYFSVDEFAQGIPLSTFSPYLFSEASALEAAADIFRTNLQGIGPFGPGGTVPNNLQVIDGNGRTLTGSGFTPGLGLEEPNIPSPLQPDSGSNLDAFDLTPGPQPQVRVFFSLQGSVSDPLEPTTSFFDSASLQGAKGGDILVYSAQTGNVTIFATADQLGLDNFGIGTDDVDALVVVENGIPGYQPPSALYDWTTGVSDLILFSVRRGSSVISTPDSLQGLPIVPGDVLIPPIGAGFLGSTPPGVFVAAENMGLNTNRGLGLSDELDALDITEPGDDPINDCNHNGIEDSQDIADNTSQDNDANGIPDECEAPGASFCDCVNSFDAPCGNTSVAEEGCLNSAGTGGKLEGSGTSSIATQSLVLTSSQLPLSNFGLVFTGNGTVSPTFVGNGSRCVGGTALYRLHVGFTGATGSFDYGPGIISDANTFPNFLTILSGETWYFQTWYRDHGGPCGADSNMTNAWSVTFTP